MTKGFEDLTLTWDGKHFFIHEQNGSGVEWLADSTEEVAKLLKGYIENMEVPDEIY